ncbi:regulatory signaling modulator protein AmpE [Luteimonas kalidii]|uniref:Regulatory signaling modulator protein AmpE n=1 Tax=Luteimonas kalidii TaxID=3042025 RepID=A0ABT6JUN3_9GAMM|nr:regulatory signaling modulator protein AmpE [Luteimonas kalidii]MDH5834401.1 regulatory signaling modulator protein AmpE [Luteimonas kalidii]
MFATLLAVVVALVLGHVARELTAVLREHGWYRAWLGWLDARIGASAAWRGRFGIVLAIAPWLLLVALVQWWLHDVSFGLPWLLFAVLVLFHAWGPRDLDRDVEAILAAPDADARRAAAARLWPEGRREQAGLRPSALVGGVFEAALRRWFGVLFWFVLLGPVGALGYRLCAITAEDAIAARLPAALVAGARALLDVLDWLPAQLATLALALVGDFDVVVGAWKEAGGASLRPDPGFLAAAGRAGVRSELADEAEDYAVSGVAPGTALVHTLGPLPELRDAMSLAWRALLLWLAVIALFVIGGWVS